MPWASATSEAWQIDGPSATGSENGSPTSTKSAACGAPQAAPGRRRDRDNRRSGRERRPCGRCHAARHALGEGERHVNLGVRVNVATRAAPVRPRPTSAADRRDGRRVGAIAIAELVEQTPSKCYAARVFRRPLRRAATARATARSRQFERVVARRRARTAGCGRSGPSRARRFEVPQRPLVLALARSSQVP